jgi:methionyl-tRNA synthetase
MTKQPFYVTTPIYYVNDKPHIGHAYTTIACDVLARFMRLDGYDVRFTTGTDEHGQKVDKSAAAKGVDPQSFTDQVSKSFRRLVDGNGECDENVLNISNTDFIRTTEPRHKIAAQELWKRIEANGFIYKDNYGGWYAVRDEAYYQENELTEKDGKKIAPSGAEVEWVEEESYFFKLSAFQDKLLAFYEKHPDFIQPESRRNEVMSFVRGGKEFEAGALKDLSISRTTFDWGVDVPGDDKHIMYVWIDALCNYLTSVGFPDDMDNFNEYWGEGERGNAVHIVGKDILRFHAVYWPAFLMAADLPLPRKIVAHGWWTIEGEKMSKSIGNVISPDDLVENYGLDQTRYFMLRAMPFGNDGDFSRDRLAEVVNADLANNIGNLAQRSLSMIQKNCDGKVPANSAADKNLQHETYVTMPSTPDDVVKLMGEGGYDVIIRDIMRISSIVNEYFADAAPWALKKEGKQDEMEAVLYNTAEAIRCIAIMLQPFCPKSARKLLYYLGYTEEELQEFDDSRSRGVPFSHLSAKYALEVGNKLPKPEGVFPRIEVKKDAA